MTTPIADGYGCSFDMPASSRRPDRSPLMISPTEAHPLTVPDPAAYVWSLCQRDDIEMFWMRLPGDEDEPGCVALGDVPPRSDQLPFTITTTTGQSLGVVRSYSQWRRWADETAPTTNSRPETYLRDALATAVAAELRADVLVTTEDALPRRPTFLDTNPMKPQSALAVIGLYLRRRGEFPLVAPDRLTFGEHLFYWSAVRSQLPSGWRWGSALVEHSAEINRDGPMLLFGSPHERLVRALRDRDRLHWVLLVRQDNDTANRATEAFDNLMVNLVSGFDAAARAAHLSLGLNPAHRRRAGWQSRQWRKEVGKARPELAALFAGGTRASQLFEVCRILRNTVYGEGLQSIRLIDGATPDRTLIALPEDVADDLAKLFDNLGGPTRWGLESIGSRTYVDPLTLVERILPEAFSALDAALQLTPVEQLLGGQHRELVAGPPSDLTYGLGTRSRVCHLLGLSPPAS
jgi:hypothetical protein